MRQLRLLLLLIAGCLAAPAFAEESAAGHYYVPPAQFNTLLEVMEAGFANNFALFRSATSSFTFDPATKSLSNLRIAIDASSLLTTNNDSQRDFANMLGSFQFSEIRIMAPDSVTFNDNKADIKATLTLHGVSKAVTLAAILNKTGKTLNEGDAVGISLATSFKRADFGMTDSADEPTKFGDTITLNLEMQALKQ